MGNMEDVLNRLALENITEIMGHFNRRLGGYPSTTARPIK